MLSRAVPAVPPPAATATRSQRTGVDAGRGVRTVEVAEVVGAQVPPGSWMRRPRGQQARAPAAADLVPRRFLGPVSEKLAGGYKAAQSQPVKSGQTATH
jgi:hypothetical protein